VSGTKELWKYQVMHMKMYLTCAPVILTLLGIPSFVVEQRLHSGRMKTETSRVAASAFGNPVDLQLTADSTKCGVLAHVEFNNNLATFIDEAKISTEIRDLVYMIANETGRSKSNKEHGLERAKNSTTVAILTCENPILPDNAHTGELVRVMPLPWGVETVLPQETVMQITDTYLENYGHFGPLFLKKVFEQQKDLKKKFNEILAEFPSNENDQNDVVTSERAKRFYAATALTGCLVEEILTEIGSKAEIESEAGLGEDQTEIGSKVEIESEVGLKTMSAIELCKALYTQNVIRAARFEPTYLKAFRSAASIFARNSVYFEEDEEEKDNKLSDLDEETIFTEKKDINHERYGWVRKCTLKDPEGNKIATEECVCFDPKVLKKLLKEEEYAFEGVLKDWRDKDLIYYSWEGKGENRYKNTTQVIRIVKGGIQTSTRAIVIPFSKILDKTGGNDEYPELALNDQHAGKKALKGAKDVLETLNLPVTERNLEIAHENRERILAICRKQQGDPTKKQNGEPVTTEELIQDYIEKESEKIKKMAETIFQKFVERGAVVAQV
jgi:Superfamily II helicase and inactivated derivatives